MTDTSEFALELKILLADDDLDDCMFFNDAIDEYWSPVSLKILNDGEQLMQHLKNNPNDYPNAVFLDLNMPRKNGLDCLTEMKNSPSLKEIPVIIYSTSTDIEKANQLYDIGAFAYIPKPADFNELKKLLHSSLNLFQQNNFLPSKEVFFANFKTSF